MRTLLALGIAWLVSLPVCFGGVPALPLERPLANGCLVHAMLYIASLDPSVGSAEIVEVVGGGGVAHVIAVVTTPDGRRFGRDEDLGVFLLGDDEPQVAYDRARREATRASRYRGSVSAVGAGERRRSLDIAQEKLHEAGLHPVRVADVIVWRLGATAYVYSPAWGCAEIRTCSRDVARIAGAALRYWTR